MLGNAHVSSSSSSSCAAMSSVLFVWMFSCMLFIRMLGIATGLKLLFRGKRQKGLLVNVELRRAVHRCLKYFTRTKDVRERE